ncbi:MAG: hypothetical protein H5T86_15000 [Armatimonadetes bacterium]|nr:hypothetical protein [Armatimonadota bacterium]
MPRPRLEGLVPRRLCVLAAVVREYVSSGRPVSSDAVLAKHGIKASPATIRNDFAVLQEMGLLTKPHHSAGRIPTAAGYRTFAERAMRPRLKPTDAALLRSRLRRPSAFTEAVAEGTRALAAVTRLAAMAALPPARAARLERVTIRPVSATVALISYELSDGRRGEVLAKLAEPLTARQHVAWQEGLMDLGREGVEALAAAQPPAGISQSAWCTVVEEILDDTGGDVFVEGAAYLAAQPEMLHSEALANLLAMAQHRGRTYRLLASVGSRRSATLFDASDTAGWLPGCAVVVQSFSVGAGTGRVAVVGPMRMDYEATVGAAAEVANLLDEAWRASLGEQQTEGEH